MSTLDDYIYFLKQQGYSVMFTKYPLDGTLQIRLSKDGFHLAKMISLFDITNRALGIEQVKENCLRDMKKELDETLKRNNMPRWTDYQVYTLTNISERLMQESYCITNESLRMKLRNIAVEIKNVIPMELIRRKGE